MRVSGLYLAGLLLLSISAVTQNVKTVRVCVVTAEAPRGNAIAQSSNQTTDRDLLLKKLNGDTGNIAIHAFNADSGEGMTCSAHRTKSDCEYIVAVTPVTSTSYSHVTPLAAPNSPSYTQPLPPSDAEQFAKEHQQEPLDNANVRYQVFENGTCRLVAARDLSKLQAVSGPPTKDSIDWLTSKVAQGVSAAIAKDAKKQRP